VAKSDGGGYSGADSGIPARLQSDAVLIAPPTNQPTARTRLRDAMEPHMLLCVGEWPSLGLSLGAALLVYFVYHVTRFHLGAFFSNFTTNGDATIFYESSRQVVAAGDYPARLGLGDPRHVYPYPPSAVLMLWSLGLAGKAGFMAIWLLLMAGGLVVVLRASLVAERAEVRAAWLAIGAAALIFADAPISWDLRNCNSNLVVLGLVLGGYALARKHPIVAGLLIAVSISLKLYTGLLLAWLLVSGPRAAFIAGLIATIGLWLALPAFAFGLNGAMQLYAGWLEQLKIIADPWIYPVVAAGHGGPPIVSLRRAAMAIAGTGPGDPETRHLLWLLWAVWPAALACYARQAAKAGLPDVPSRAALADWVVLLLAPLPLNPWLEPYHAIPIVPGVLLLVVVALDRRPRQADLRIALTALAAIGISRLLGLPFALRGLLIYGQFLVLLAALAALRARLDPGRAYTGSQRPDSAERNSASSTRI
jgi:Glycosyltransferase family 87